MCADRLPEVDDAGPSKPVCLYCTFAIRVPMTFAELHESCVNTLTAGRCRCPCQTKESDADAEDT